MFKFKKKESESEENKKKNLIWLRVILVIFFVLLISIFVLYTKFEKSYSERIYPGIFFGEFDLSGKTKLEAREILEKRINSINQNGVRFKYKDNETPITPIVSSLGGDIAYQVIFFDVDKLVDKAFELGRNKGLVADTYEKFKIWSEGHQLDITFGLEDKAVEEMLKENFGQFEKTAQDAILNATSTKGKIEISIEEEKIGFKLNYSKAIEELKINLKELNTSIIEIEDEEDHPKIYKADCEHIEDEAKILLERAPLNLTYEGKKWIVNKEEIASWLKLAQGIDDKIIIDFKTENIEKFIADNIEEKVNQEAVDARFEIKENRVVEFITSKDGIKVENIKTASKIKTNFLAGDKKNIEIVTEVAKSSKPTEDANDLGIREIIGTGHSNFAGSPYNRIHNIKNGTDSLHGLLIKPDEEFSLITALGDIDGESGYKQELVIKGNKTIPEYGGGLCQVGTTLFRTVTESGLPVTARRNHSYRVSYYEPAGTDATIYDPWPDFKFLNDTGNHILIQARFDGNDMYFDFWGTNDKRIIDKTEPTIYNITKPGPTKMIETTDLEPGVKKCTESSHNGADAFFDYKVTYPNGEVKEERFTSHYVPWRAVCLIGVEEKTEETISTSTEVTIN